MKSSSFGKGDPFFFPSGTSFATGLLFTGVAGIAAGMPAGGVVAAATGAPHSGQKRALSTSSVPHFVQNFAISTPFLWPCHHFSSYTERINKEQYNFSLQIPVSDACFFYTIILPDIPQHFAGSNITTQSHQLSFHISQCFAVYEYGHRAVVHGINLHIRTEFSRFHLEAPFTAFPDHHLIERDGRIRSCSLGKSRTS